MPRRKVKLENGYYYHVLNRSIQSIPIFGSPRQSQIFLELLDYYNNEKPPIKFSFRNSPSIKRSSNQTKLVEILNYCIMPNHFHLTLKQNIDNGISTFMQRALNSFSHFYNKKFKNQGALFQGTFKSIQITTTEQLIHLSRYIHLNPVTAHIVDLPQDYEFSSFKIYINPGSSIMVNSAPVLTEFGSIDKYKEFVLNRRDYQRNLAAIKKLLLEK